MSSASTRRDKPASAPSISNARLSAAGPCQHAPDDAGMDGGDGRIERRRDGMSGGSPMDILARLPVVVMLERMAVPVLVTARDGIILFANTAFANMVGYRQDRLAGLALHQVYLTVPQAICAASGIQALANLVVELRHREGWTVRAKMSKSALVRRDDPIALVTFENLTEQLWMNEP